MHLGQNNGAAIAENRSGAFARHIYLIWAALAPFRVQTAILFLVMFLAASSEAMGIGMIIPLLTTLLGDSRSLGVDSILFSKFESFLRSSFSEETLLLGIAFILAAVYFMKMVLVILKTFLAVRFSNTLRRYWMCGILERYVFSDYRKMVSQKRGILLNNLTNEPSNAQRALRVIVTYLYEAVVCLAIYITMLVAAWKIALLLTVIAIVTMGLFWGLAHRYSLFAGKRTLSLNQSLMAQAEQCLNALREVKAFALERETLALFRKHMDELLSVSLRYRTLIEVPVPVGEFCVVALLVTGVLYAKYGGGASASAMIPLMGFFAIASQKLYIRLGRLFSESMSVMSLLPSIELVHLLVSEPVERVAGENQVRIDRLDGDIVFDQVSYSYTDTGPQLFDRLSLKFPKGKMIGIIGRSGSGKSTVLDLLCGLYPGYEGRIRVGQYDLRELDLNSWHRIIGLVLQEPFIFNATIRDNIMLSRQGAREEEMLNAAKKAHAHEFIARLPEGYDTVVADRGTLSVGQKQRIAIARAILRDPDIYIFDEATSALDPESERWIRTFIDEVRKEKTVVLITHRHINIENADVVYVLDHGRIIDSGHYRDLKLVAADL